MAPLPLDPSDEVRKVRMSAAPAPTTASSRAAGQDDDVVDLSSATAASASPAAARAIQGDVNQRRVMLKRVLSLAKVNVPAHGVVNTITKPT